MAYSIRLFFGGVQNMANGEVNATVEVEYDYGKEKKLQILNKLYMNAKAIGKTLNTKIGMVKKEKLTQIFNDAVDLFYSDYEPGSMSNSIKKRKYKRTKDLYNAINIFLDSNGIFQAETGADFMQHEHHQDNEYVYWAAFGAGSHGGFPVYNQYDYEYEMSGSPGDLYWRTGFHFNRWYNKPAPVLTVNGKETSIEDIIKKEWHEYLYGDEFESFVMQVLEQTLQQYLN